MMIMNCMNRFDKRLIIMFLVISIYFLFIIFLIFIYYIVDMYKKLKGNYIVVVKEISWIILYLF